jgi:NADPH:quinone reductase-like Zn-dependent oxidoreductase
MQRRGMYPPPPGASEILGVEVSGTVEEIGKAGREHQSKPEEHCQTPLTW